MLPEFDNLDAALRYLCKECLQRGQRVSVPGTKSPSNNEETKEIRNVGFTLTNPRARLLWSPKRRIRLGSAIWRFVWNLAGSNRLDEVALYDPRAAQYSDDKLSIPGSCEGYRLRNARIGLDQIEETIKLLRSDPSSRRATCVLYFPEDIGRDSRDIPCTIAITFSIRDSRLEATTIMRSNSIVGVLPYDVFFFSMLAEVVASILNVELGSYHHFMVACQIFARDYVTAEAIANHSEPIHPQMMAPMPRMACLDALLPILKFQQMLRYAGINTLTEDRLQEEVTAIGEGYWQEFAAIMLLAASHIRNEHGVSAEKLFPILSSPIATYLRATGEL